LKTRIKSLIWVLKLIFILDFLSLKTINL